VDSLRHAPICQLTTDQSLVEDFPGASDGLNLAIWRMLFWCLIKLRRPTRRTSYTSEKKMREKKFIDSQGMCI